ncbi:MAG: tyrosine-type recombinase/integrase [Candidatus Actinomarina sp.]|jgi:integrase/recombinase XerD|nr:tyrosine-type recombinase/integrase [Candidatus Actinomarina sp.]MDA3037318.1 tyrosine-type recombinase/integrase [Actinomycetota bacterium]
MNIKLKINQSIISYSEYLLYQKGLSQNTVDSYTSDLKKLSNYLQNQDLSKTNIDNFFIEMSEFHYSVSTKKRMHSSIKNFLKYISENEDYESIDISDIKLKSSNKLPEVLSITDIENMINFYNHETYLESRNRTVIDVLYSTGCRVSELCDINLSDIDLDEKYLKLKGKGSKQRIVPIGSMLYKNLLQYLNVRNTFLQNRGEPLFLSKSKNKLDRTAVFRIIKKTAKNISLQVDVHPHTLRHSAATHMLEGGCDLRTVQEFLGHSSVSTTQIYTKVTKEFLEEAFTESHPRS